MTGRLGAGEIVRTAFGEVRHHKLRSTLTLLGIVLGTLSITVMTSLLDGVVQTVWEGMDKLGLDGVVFVVPREATAADDNRGIAIRVVISAGTAPRKRRRGCAGSISSSR